MKKIELETSKGKWVLIDESDLPKVDKIIVENDNNFIKLSDITEEQASEVVVKYEHQPSYINELFYRIKSKGVHLFENPYKRPFCLLGVKPCTAVGRNVCKCDNYDKEVQKTFYNPYLFKVM